MTMGETETPEQRDERRGLGILRHNPSDTFTFAQMLEEIGVDEPPLQSLFAKTIAQAVAADDAAHGKVLVDGWRGIESAPREQLILVAHHPDNYWRGRVVIGFAHSDYNGHKDVICEDGRAGPPIRPSPTHWMPLPPPPTEKTNVG